MLVMRSSPSAVSASISSGSFSMTCSASSGAEKPYSKGEDLLLHIGGGDGIAGSMPDSQHAHMLLFLMDMKNDSVNAFSFAVQQVAGRIAKLFCFGNGGAAGGKLLQTENGL